MKKWLLLLILIPVLLTSACAVAQVSYRLGDDFSVSTEYMLTLDSSGGDAAQYTNAITQYWGEMGFTASFDNTDGVFTLTGNKRDAYDSPEAAAQAFSAMLKDENSLFEDAKFLYTPSFEYDQYSLTGTVSLKDVIRQSDVQNIPEGEIDTLESSAAEGTYTLCITLPGEIASTNADSTENGVCTWTLIYGESTDISIETSKRNQENLDYAAALEEQQRRDGQLLLLCGGVIGAILIALIIVTIVRKRKNRPLKVRIKKF